MIVPKDMHKLVIKYKDPTSISEGKKISSGQKPKNKKLTD